LAAPGIIGASCQKVCTSFLSEILAKLIAGNANNKIIEIINIDFFFLKKL
jgi:hypothetical protein